jgi:hypothetical protein
MDNDCYWLESKGRRYERWATDAEHSVWICVYCDMEDVDPDEHDEDCEVIDG